MILLCPRCGTPYGMEIRGDWFRTSAQCVECGVAVGDVTGMLKPSDDEVRYELEEWPAPDRALVTAALVELDAPYRWEPGLVLVVPAAAESDVDRLLDDSATGDQDADGDYAAGGEDEDLDGGEEAQAAMGDLFVAADRLQHAPWDKELALDLCTAAEAVGESLPPYGVEPKVWQHIQKLGAALADAACEEIVDDEEVAAASRSLRELLRDYV